MSGPGDPHEGAGRAPPTTPRPLPHGVSAAASRVAANCAPPPARPAVIAAAVVAARRVSASAPPPRLIGAAGRGGGGAPPARSPASGASTASRAAISRGGWSGGGAVPGMEGTRGAHRPAVHRELSQPPPLLSPQNAPHIALGPHLRPPFLGVPSALCQTPGEEWAGVGALCLCVCARALVQDGEACLRATCVHGWDPDPPPSPPPHLLKPKPDGVGGLGWPWCTQPPGFMSVPFPPGYGFLPPAQAEMLARQQELLRKQNLAR